MNLNDSNETTKTLNTNLPEKAQAVSVKPLVKAHADGGAAALNLTMTQKIYLLPFIDLENYREATIICAEGLSNP